MIYIGNHVSVTDGYEAMGRHEISLGGDTFAFFPRNPRGGKSKEVAPEDIAALRELIKAENFGPLVVHGAYTMNLCSAKEEVRANSLEMITDDLIRLQQLPGHYYNFHPGSHTGQGTETGIRQIAEGLVAAIRAAGNASKSGEPGSAAGLAEQNEAADTGSNAPASIPGSVLTDSALSPLNTVILLETMTGKGSEIGGSFEELRAIIDTAAGTGELTGELSSEYIRSRLGVCLDTCHVWDAGYDIVNDLDGVLAEFDRVIGLDNLKAIHLNDSKNPCGARKDRHDKLGQGMIGADALRRVVRHPQLQGLPFILETPNEDDGYREEIRTVREWML